VIGKILAEYEEIPTQNGKLRPKAQLSNSSEYFILYSNLHLQLALILSRIDRAGFNPGKQRGVFRRLVFDTNAPTT
jgi:hypothetical protein